MSNLKTVHVNDITNAVAGLCIKACNQLPSAVCALLDQAIKDETYAPARETLRLISHNATVAKEMNMPMCQDTGMTVVYVFLGQDVHIEGGLLTDAINAGVSKGYIEGYLRKSMVGDPLRRKNTGDNTPAIIHIKLVAGNSLSITVAPKGIGSENMSRLCMLTPASGIEGVKRFIIETVKIAGANPCPPMMLGVGIGGSFEQVAAIAKEALVLPREEIHPDPFYAELEATLLEEINSLGIGPQGFGGRTTALSIRIKAAPTHIAGLPVAVNVGCHATRHASITL